MMNGVEQTEPEHLTERDLEQDPAIHHELRELLSPFHRTRVSRCGVVAVERQAVRNVLVTQ